MKDISIYDYFGPGVYLLYNYPEETVALIAEQGYKVCCCENLSLFIDIVNGSKTDFFLINNTEDKFDEYIDIIALSAQSSIKKIVIDTLVKGHQRDLYLKFIEKSCNLGYFLDSAFSLINPGYDDSFHGDQHLKILLSYSQEQRSSSDEIMDENAINEKSIASILTYIRPGDRVLIVSKSADSLKRILSEQTKASLVQNCSLESIENTLQQDRSYHFILVDKYVDNELINVLGSMTTSLLPAGRYVFFNTSQAVIHALDSLNVQPEVYFFYEQGRLRTQIHQGEEITTSPELCVFMKSPLENTKIPYEETIYGYSSPPENLLSFARDYTNPWLIRGIVEFPFRNRSAYHLKQYSRQILYRFDLESPDYAAALAVLGYQFLNNGDDSDEILNKILAYCSGVVKIALPTPHQYRWYISLSTLLGLIYNKNNDKIKALIHFSHAANTSVEKFSPSIGTKTLQSLYLQTIILISLNKLSCAEITVERGIKRGIHLLYYPPEELVGELSQPFNFVLFIYHDIIDWIIKLINIKNAISCKKFNIANHDNSNTWSALLHERMNAINNMSRMIDERDSAIYLQNQLIDSLQEKVHTCDNIIHQQNKFIDRLQEDVRTNEHRINELLNKNNEVLLLNKEKELHLTQLTADLDRARLTLRKINNTPLIGLLLRMLKIK